jgi:hypothetical protein
MARKKRQYEIDCAGAEGDLTDELLKKSLRKKKPKADKVPDSNLKLLMKMIPGVTGSNRSAEVKDDLDLSSNDGSLRGLGSSSNRLYQLSELVKKESKDLPQDCILDCCHLAIQFYHRKRHHDHSILQSRILTTYGDCWKFGLFNFDDLPHNFP